MISGPGRLWLGLAAALQILTLCQDAAAAAADPAPARDARPAVEIVGDGPARGKLAARIRLDDAQRGGASLVWVVGPLDQARWSALLARVRSGTALIVLAGQASLPSQLGLGAFAARREDRCTLEPTTHAPAALKRWVIWPSAPQAGRRLVPSPDSSWQRWLVSRGRPALPAVVSRRLGRGRVIVATLELAHGSNRDLLLWPYFNYTLHVLGALAREQTPMRYGAWPAAPLPGLSSLWIIGLLLGVAWLVTLVLFLRARRNSRAHPELLEDFFPAEAVRVAPSDAEDEHAGPDAPGGGGAGKGGGAWQSIGFARPLAGFLTLAGALFLLFVPFYWLTNIVVPNDVQPFPQARGMWDFAWEALQMVWFLFDAGTFVAFVKYFAEYRVKDPKEALRSAQFFVWWQILTGLVQVTLACVAAVVILPNTRYGYTSSFVMLVALGQYPGFFGVITFFFQAYQRFDYNIGLDLLSDWILRFVLMIPFVLLFRHWGAANPQYGEAFGAAVGIGVGFYVSSLVSFALGIWLYRRLGLSLRPLFMAHFDRATIKRMLWYGLRVVAGKFLFRAAQAIDKVMISLLLLNYTEWLGLKGQIHYNLMFLFPVAYRFFETSMAALSESYGNGKRTLTQYYVVRFTQVGMLYAAIGCSLLLALGPLFVREAMDPQWARAADYLVIAALLGALFAPAWLSDMLQKGAGRPGLFAIVLGLEQAARIGLFALLIPTMQFTGFYLAILLTLVAKVIGGWIVNHLVILRLRLFLWQMFVAPALAGGATFGLWRLLVLLWSPSGALSTSVLFFGAALAGFPLCFFFFGLAGGGDAAFADELDQASRMTGPLRPLTRLFHHAARAGFALSPLHGRFPVTISEQARVEAEQLQRQRDG
jgi:O-antigen/teichoic acid export membrane protein